MIIYMIALLLPVCAFADRFEIFSHFGDDHVDYFDVVDYETCRHYLYRVPSFYLVDIDFEQIDVADIIFHYKPYVSYVDSLEVDYGSIPMRDINEY